MQSSTSIKMTITNKADTKEIARLIKTGLLSKATDEYEENAIDRFYNDFTTTDNQIIADCSYTLGSWEFEFLREALITVAKESDNEFTFEAEHISNNCGYEAYIEAEYKDGVLTIREIASEDMVGCCSDEDCMEFIVHALEYDPNKTYICPECGRVVPEDELFEYGVPTWEVEEIKIR